MATSVDQATFARHVEDAVGHVFDHFYLEFHPLSGTLAASAPPALRGRMLSRLLVAAIERLKPEPDVPTNSLAWRKYRYTYLRYVQALSLDEISKQLGVSDRQGRRDHRQALDALINLLWNDYRTKLEPGSVSNQADNDPPTSAALESELLRLGRVAPREACQLAEVLRGAIVTVTPLIEQQQCQVTLNLPPNLPRVAINPLFLREITIDMITRALDLGGVPQTNGIEATYRTIEVTAAEVVGKVTLIVATCPTTPAVNVDSLATSRRMAEMQGASLRVEDIADHMIRLTLEITAVESATILVVDDNPDVALLFRRYLGQSYRLVQATLGEEAIELAERLHPALITLDVMMPGLDGWQILEALRRNPNTASVPVVVCSILTKPSLAAALGAAAYLPKPVNPLALRSLLDRQLLAPTSAHPG